jgi:hypothetical protein
MQLDKCHIYWVIIDNLDIFLIVFVQQRLWLFLKLQASKFATFLCM